MLISVILSLGISSAHAACLPHYFEIKADRIIGAVTEADLIHQDTDASCSMATAATVLNAMYRSNGIERRLESNSDLRALLPPGHSWIHKAREGGEGLSGLEELSDNLNQLSSLTQTPFTAEPILASRFDNDLQLKRFIREKLLTPSSWLVVNLFDHEGHFSIVRSLIHTNGGWVEILDVDRGLKNPSVRLPVALLLRMIKGIDPQSGKPRGFIHVRAPLR